MIYVQRVSDGASIHLSLLDFCDRNGLIKVDNLGVPQKPVAFLHSTLSDETKEVILDKAVELKMKVLIATSAAGTGINLPVDQFVGWGLDAEPTGIVQSQGRTARTPMRKQGNVMWVHNSKLHGQRISAQSKVRELLIKPQCLRKTMNGWFDHGMLSVPETWPEAEFCCSQCMKDCVSSNNCANCHTRLATFEPEVVFDDKVFVPKFTQFLTNLKINERSPGSTPVYKESSIGKCHLWIQI